MEIDTLCVNGYNMTKVIADEFEECCIHTRVPCRPSGYTSTKSFVTKIARYHINFARYCVVLSSMIFKSIYVTEFPHSDLSLHVNTESFLSVLAILIVVIRYTC